MTEPGLQHLSLQACIAVVLVTGSSPRARVNCLHLYHPQTQTMSMAFITQDPALVDGFYYLDQAQGRHSAAAPTQANGVVAPTLVDGFAYPFWATIF